MNYQRLVCNLDKYARDNLFAYVSDSFRPHLRRDPKYQQWQRLRSRASLKSMTPAERHILGVMLEVKAALLVTVNSTSGD